MEQVCWLPLASCLCVCVFVCLGVISLGFWVRDVFIRMSVAICIIVSPFTFGDRVTIPMHANCCYWCPISYGEISYCFADPSICNVVGKNAIHCAILSDMDDESIVDMLKLLLRDDPQW